MVKSKLPAVAAVGFEELAYAYQIGGLAASGTIPQSGVAGMGVNLDMGEGDIQRIDLTDVPFNRAAIAIRDQFPEGMLMPLMTRIMAMGELLELPEASRYTREAPNGSGHFEISDAILKVAARMPLNAKLRFARKQFFAQVKELYEQAPDLKEDVGSAAATNPAD